MKHIEKITEYAGKLTTIDRLNLASGVNTRKMCEAEVIHLDLACIVEEVDGVDGVRNEIIFIRDGDTWYGSVSRTFIDSFIAIMTTADDLKVHVTDIRVETGQSKNGRDFIVCRAEKAEDMYD